MLRLIRMLIMFAVNGYRSMIIILKVFRIVFVELSLRLNVFVISLGIVMSILFVLDDVVRLLIVFV